MDDLKMSMYISARNMIGSTPPGHNYVCIALMGALASEVGLQVAFQDEKKALKEFFPEFFALYDGYWDESMYHAKKGKHRAWWPCEWKEPRLAILDFIINNR